jgi:hypothetical protein
MKIMKLCLLMVCVASIFASIQAEAYCAKCHQMPEYITSPSTSTNDFKYYEDYLKEQEAVKAQQADQQ